MMRWAAFFVLSIWSVAAQASDDVKIGPAPAWVRDIAAPEGGKQDQAAVRSILQDQQVAFDKGRTTIYSRAVLQIQTSQGLPAGNISFAWDPDKTVPTVNAFRIHRGNQTIDILASQKFTVVRRETNLENAILDGRLTATLQPSGLQVGDIIEFALSMETSDPVLQGHVENIGGGWNEIPIGRAHLRVQWPAAIPLNIRQTEGLPVAKQAREGNLKSYELTADNLNPILFPNGAPPRYGLNRLVEMTDYRSWSEIGVLLTPLYRKASTIASGDPLEAEIAKIRALSPDPKKRAEAALALVQDNIRYVWLAMGDGGLVPADASTTWSRRFGDCKGKSALLIALLHALDISADPVLVNVYSGDGIDQRLPMIDLFNHVIVRASIGGKTHWLDGTRSGDRDLDKIIAPNFGWALPLVDRGAEPVRMVQSPLDAPMEDTKITLDASNGLMVPAPMHVEKILRNDTAIGTNYSLNNLSPDVREQSLRQYWREKFSFVDIAKVDVRFDPQTNEMRLTMDGMAQMEWKDGWYETDDTALGWKADFHRDPGPHQDAPFAINYPFFTTNSETIILPKGFDLRAAKMPADINQVIAGIEYVRRISVSGQSVTISTSKKSTAPEFAAADAPKFQAALRALYDDRVYLRRPDTYMPTSTEIGIMKDKAPKSLATFVFEGWSLVQQQKFEDAIAAFTEALKLDPQNSNVLGLRAYAYGGKGDLVAAARDAQAALKIDPKDFSANLVQIELAGQAGRLAEAGSICGQLLAGSMKSLQLFSVCAQVYYDLGKFELALVNSEAALKLDPKLSAVALIRANIFRKQGKEAEALAEASALSKANPDDTFAHVTSARIYNAFGKQKEAIAEFDRALAIHPDAYIYVNRAESRPATDIEGRRADYDMALKLQPNMPEAIGGQAQLEYDRGNYAAAIALFTKGIAANGQAGGSPLILRRAFAYLRSGQNALAQKDFASARAAAKTAQDFNKLCWQKAVAGLALQSALEECDAGLSKQPDTWGIADSRALVLLRLGRIDEAIEAYTRVIAQQPRSAPSLYGRALAYDRKGNKLLSDADRKEAVRISPKVQSDFESYGLKFQN